MNNRNFDDALNDAREVCGSHSRTRVVNEDRAVCVELKVDGHRGELTIMRAARALAATKAVRKSTMTDVRRVVGMSLRHRLRRDILEETATTERIEQAVESIMNQPPPRPPAGKDQKDKRFEGQATGSKRARRNAVRSEPTYWR